jgi:hypothetical protein
LKPDANSVRVHPKLKFIHKSVAEGFHMDGEIEAVGSRFTHEDYLVPCSLGYGDAVEKQWQCSKSSEGVAFVLIGTHRKTLIKFCELGAPLLYWIPPFLCSNTNASQNIVFWIFLSLLIVFHLISSLSQLQLSRPISNAVWSLY